MDYLNKQITHRKDLIQIFIFMRATYMRAIYIRAYTIFDHKRFCNFLKLYKVDFNFFFMS